MVGASCDGGGDVVSRGMMKHNIVVATHHKTGTVWMSTVFKAIANDIDAEYVDFWSRDGQVADALKAPFILFNYHSDFRGHSDILSREDVRILHLIRDPRDVLISAMHYHKKSNETWLHEPVPGYDDVTYQRRLNALATRFEQYVFEMEHSTAGTLRGVMGWQYGRANCFEARYEALRQDSDLAYWTRIAASGWYSDAVAGIKKNHSPAKPANIPTIWRTSRSPYEPRGGAWE